MNILLVTAYFYPEQFKVNDLALKLSKDHQVTVLTGIPNYPNGKYLHGYSKLKPFIEYWNNLKIIRLPIIPRGDSRWMLFLNYLSLFILFGLANLFLWVARYERIVFVGFSPSLLGITCFPYRIFFKKTKCILWLQDFWPDDMVSTGFLKSNSWFLAPNYKFASLMYKIFDKLCATSSGMAKELSRRSGRDVDILWNFPETEIIPEHQKNIKKDRRNKIKIMYMGNVSGNQNIAQILKAFEDIGIQRKFELHIYCHGAREIDQVKKATINMPSTIYFHGNLNIKELAHVSYNYDYGIVSLGNHPNLHNILPSRVQSFCAMRMPLISFGCPELALLIKKYQFGYFINEYSAGGLILILNELYDTYSVNKREEMAINSIELTKSIFSIDRACRIICE